MWHLQLAFRSVLWVSSFAVARALFIPITPLHGLSYNHQALGMAIVPTMISRWYIIERVISPAVGKVTHWPSHWLQSTSHSLPTQLLLKMGASKWRHIPSQRNPHSVTVDRWGWQCNKKQPPDPKLFLTCTKHPVLSSLSQSTHTRNDCTFLPSPSPWQPLFYLLCMTLTSLVTSCKWNHTASVLLRLAYCT